MKKTQLFILFCLGILFGIFGTSIKTQWDRINQPLFEEGKINIQAIVDSIGQAIDINHLPKAGTTERFQEVLNILEDTYYDQDKINTGIMYEHAVKAFVDALEDPYTVYMDSNELSGFQEEIKGQNDFEGIGAVVSKKDYYVMIEEIIKDSPAYKAGLMPLDRIIMVNTGSVKDLTVNEAVSLIRGPKGTKVTLIIERIKKDDTKEVIEKEVTRDKLSIPSVSSKILTGKNNIGYIAVSIIGEETENLFRKTIVDLKEQNIKGLILDLRGNGGGLLPIAVEIASHFVPKDKVVVSAKYQQLGEETFPSKGYGDFQKIPVVVLFDGMTASAGEIIALALQEQIGATLVGTTTFGKGSIQTMTDFVDGASLKYTVGKRYSPNGRNIDKVGIEPDIKVEFDRDAYTNSGIDKQLQKAVETINNK